MIKYEAYAANIYHVMDKIVKELLVFNDGVSVDVVLGYYKDKDGIVKHDLAHHFVIYSYDKESVEWLFGPVMMAAKDAGEESVLLVRDGVGELFYLHPSPPVDSNDDRIIYDGDGS